MADLRPEPAVTWPEPVEHTWNHYGRHYDKPPVVVYTLWDVSDVPGDLSSPSMIPETRYVLVPTTWSSA